MGLRIGARSVAGMVFVGLTACGGGGGGGSHTALPAAPTAPPAPTAPSTTTPLAPSAVDVSVLLPAAGSAAAAALPRTAAATNATQSMRITVMTAGSTQIVDTVTVNFAPAAQDCAAGSNGTTCTIPLALSAGSYTASIQTFGSPGAAGTALSLQQGIALTVPASATVGTPALIPWVLYGVPHAIVATPTAPSGTVLRTTSANQATTYGDGAIQYVLAAFDANGAQIVGAGAPAWTVASSNSGFVVTPASSQSPNVVTVTPPATTAPGVTQLTLGANFPDDPGSSAGACIQAGAVCAGNATLDRLTIVHDDWTTYEHDFARTGDQTQATGLSTATAPNLALRWKASIPGGSSTSSLAVSDGNIVVADYDVIADFSAIDGSLLWSRTLPYPAAKTATIDPTAGLVFVGTRNSNSTSALPSPYYALRIVDGSIAWQTTLDDMTKGSEVVADGSVYVPTAGGDPPSCVNGGVQALNESTGAVEWTWYVNAATNPGGGGAVWGAIGYDGSRLVFGTGNTCQTPITTANGEAALDLNGHLLWSFVAEQNSTWDYDTGSSTLIRNAGSSSESAVFLNKNGIMYSIDPASSNGALRGQITVNPNFGYGFWASPSSDGNVTIVGTGEYADSTQSLPRLGETDAYCPTPGTSHPRRIKRVVAGYHSTIAAFGSAGTQLWSYQTAEIPADYAALANGVAVFEADSYVRALDAATGAVLWSYPTAGTVDAGPVVVPSGVYAVDQSGNLYAFALPFATTTSARLRRTR